MSEKMRGAIFNALGDLGGLKVLDAYAGSGALGLEAISRGATRVVAIDGDKSAYTTILRNARALGVQTSVQAHCMNVRTWVQGHTSHRFDVIFADPPYDDVKPDVIQDVATLLVSGGVLVLSLPPSNGELAMPPNVQLVQHKSYNDAQLWFYTS